MRMRDPLQRKFRGEKMKESQAATDARRTSFTCEVTGKERGKRERGKNSQTRNTLRVGCLDSHFVYSFFASFFLSYYCSPFLCFVAYPVFSQNHLVLPSFMSMMKVPSFYLLININNNKNRTHTKMQTEYWVAKKKRRRETKLPLSLEKTQ